MEKKRLLTRAFFCSGKEGCYAVDETIYENNEAIFFKLIHNQIHGSNQSKEEWLSKKPKAAQATIRKKKNGEEYSKN